MPGRVIQSGMRECRTVEPGPRADPWCLPMIVPPDDISGREKRDIIDSSRIQSRQRDAAGAGPVGGSKAGHAGHRLALIFGDDGVHHQ
jgi:hypothetical protein